MKFKQNAPVNIRRNQELSSGINWIKFWIIICLPLVEMLITAVLICKFCNTCSQMKVYKWYLIGLIPVSIISSVLIVTIRGIRSRLPINYIILLLNTLLLCFAFIPPILRITIGYIVLSSTIAAVITLLLILLGMFIRFKISRIWLLTFSFSCIAVGLILSFALCSTHSKIAAYVMGECSILSVLPVLLFIGQQVKFGSSKRMFDSDYILDAVMISIMNLYIFYSIAVQILAVQKHHNFTSC
ncbi:hypothetical protein MN116_005403 [Schistosoma mekongi]|uniref:Uncharacterized protein n=1 Tax=Schistosoma mekongi TaxID=38744 RepID=A0AAE2D5B4_SCHME|nr:hypothetical protein MN116_005403 [Schistosoma mekongi]